MTREFWAHGAGPISFPGPTLQIYITKPSSAAEGTMTMYMQMLLNICTVSNDEHDHHWSAATAGGLRSTVHSRLRQRQKTNVGQSPASKLQQIAVSDDW